MPKRVKLVNSGEDLKFLVEYMPEFLNPDNEETKTEYLHIMNIPVDDHENEPIVIEIEW